jgi:predicted nucleotidyltransferase
MVYKIEQEIPKEQLTAFCRKNHIRRMSLFGSALRGKPGPESDIDLLVEFNEDHIPGLFELSRMELEMTDILGRKADIRTAEELSQYFRDDVVKEASVQYCLANHT